MSATKITMLGTSGSGKTCYLVGMYNNIYSYTQGYFLSTYSKYSNTDAFLCNIYQDMKYNTGMERFPKATDKKTEYAFYLRYDNNDIMSFDWVDYPGGLLDRKLTANAQEYTLLKQIILQSSILFLCVDGALLQGDDIEDKIDNINEDCGKIMNTLLSEYQKNNTLPPIGILITKYDLCKNDTNNKEIEKIMRECFSPLFQNDGKKQIVVIIPVSLGANLAENNYAGQIQPSNIDLPIFLGIWYSLHKEIEHRKSKIKQEHNTLKTMIQDLNQKINQEKERWWLFRSDSAIAKWQDQLLKSQEQLSKNEEDFINLCKHLDRYAPKLKHILDDRLKMIYFDGVRQKSFSAIKYPGELKPGWLIATLKIMKNLVQFMFNETKLALASLQEKRS